MKWFNVKRLLLISVCLFCITSCQQTAKQNTIVPSFNKELVYYNDALLVRVKEKIALKDPYFTAHYHKVIEAGEQALNDVIQPVTTKIILPPSKDPHDYASYAPYRWPDPAKKDGLPWIARDGIINPTSRDSNADYVKSAVFFKNIKELAWAYYFSDDERYAEKAIESIKIWYLNPETRVNPNINFGQAIPGLHDGSRAGLIEWVVQENVVTALQIFQQKGILPPDVAAGMFTWFSEYLQWLETSPIAIAAGQTRQNHANYYNYQRVGLHLLFNHSAQAKAIVEDAKLSRIADQITPDGKQPKEFGRTKSVHYAVYNLWALTEVTLMGRKVGVDLWEYETTDGRSLSAAYHYLKPYAEGKKQWLYKEISPGGAAQQIEYEMKPLFSKASTALGLELIDEKLVPYQNLLSLDVLRYPPLSKMSN